MCASSDAQPLAEAYGLGFHPLPISAREWLSREATAVHGGPLRMNAAMRRYFDTALTHQFECIAEAARGTDLIVGGGVQLGAPSVAEALGVPYRFVAYCPIVFPSEEHPPFVLEREVRSPALNRALWRLFIPTFSLLVRRAMNRKRRALGLGKIGDVFAHVRSQRPLLAADPDLAPVPLDAGPDITQVGFLLPPRSAELPGKLEAFLAAGAPPVYVGFGSMPDPNPDGTTRALLEALGGLGVRIVLSGGWAGLGRGALPEGVMVVDDVPHPLLFPRMAAVVHHGGAGTTSVAAWAGVPQLVVPHLLDQFYWGRRVEKLGLGPPMLPRRSLTPQALAESLGVALEVETIAERARGLGERIRERDGRTAAAEALLAG
jgi:vancomycin aglycone glucosyltransferase